jgi:hypothetical protein
MRLKLGLFLCLLSSPALAGSGTIDTSAPTGLVVTTTDGSGHHASHTVITDGTAGGSSAAVTQSNLNVTGGTIGFQKSLQPTVTAGSYTNSMSVGGLLTFNVFHNSVLAEGSVAQFCQTGISAASVPMATVVYILNKAPTTTPTDHVSWTMNAADWGNMVGQPTLVGTVVPQAGTTSGMTCVTFGNIPTNNQDGSVTTNLYAVVVNAGTAFTLAATNDAVFTLQGYSGW